MISILRGCIASLVIGLNTALAALPIFTIALLKLMVPLWSWRRGCSSLLNRFAEFWVNLNELWLPKPDRVIWSNFDPDTLRNDESCLLTSNHQSWADIFMVQHLLNQRTPQIKFFLKQELIWIPVIGLCWWALDFPFMKRYSKSYLKKHPERKGKDQQTTQKACEKFRDIPIALYNFMEGTRFSTEKHARQKSKFKYLLNPRVGGTGLVLSALGDQVSMLIDITLYYRKSPPGFWELLCGDNGGVEIHVQKREIPVRLLNRDYSGDSEFRAELMQWVSEIWEEKDRLLIELNAKSSKPSAPDDEKKTTAIATQ